MSRHQGSDMEERRMWWHQGCDMGERRVSWHQGCDMGERRAWQHQGCDMERVGYCGIRNMTWREEDVVASGM